MKGNAELYGFCEVCGSPRGVISHEKDGIKALSLVCAADSQHGAGLVPDASFPDESRNSPDRS